MNLIYKYDFVEFRESFEFHEILCREIVFLILLIQRMKPLKERVIEAEFQIRRIPHSVR